MNTTHWRRAPLAACCAALAALALAAAGATAATAGTRAVASGSGGAPIVTTDDGAVRGVAAGSINEFLGIPYAAPPTGHLRWRPPQPPAEWQGVRDATQFGPSCPQPPQNSPSFPPGPISEDCLYLNVYTPTRSSGDLRSGDEGGRPVLVWIHGGGLTSDAGRNYDPAKLAADGVVVVTINYRLGALGFLAHPALASRPGGPSGNYGLMDQQAALRWVQRQHRPVRRQPAQRHHRRRVGRWPVGACPHGLRRLPRAVPEGDRRRAGPSRSTSSPWPPLRPPARPSPPRRAARTRPRPACATCRSPTW